MNKEKFNKELIKFFLENINALDSGEIVSDFLSSMIPEKYSNDPDWQDIEWDNEGTGSFVYSTIQDLRKTTTLEEAYERIRMDAEALGENTLNQLRFEKEELQNEED